MKHDISAIFDFRKTNKKFELTVPVSYVKQGIHCNRAHHGSGIKENRGI
jgi:hypothetical protein